MRESTLGREDCMAQAQRGVGIHIPGQMRAGGGFWAAVPQASAQAASFCSALQPD